MPKSGITLHGGVGHEEKSGSGAVLLKLGDGMLESLKKASQAKERLQFITGNSPKLRIGGRTIDLTLSNDAFRNELYVSTAAGSLSDLQYAGSLSHRAVVKQRERKPTESGTGTDEALAALRNSMASLEQEKQSNQANIEKGLLAVPKNRFDAAKKHRRLGSAGGQPSGSFSPSANTSAPTSAPVSDNEAKTQAMRTAIAHLLAMKPATTQTVQSRTHIPRVELDNILQKIARRVDGDWTLADRGYKDLDVWTFGYSSQEDRQSAIDNAIRAYDRLRIGRDEKIWQKLLSSEDRGKGIVLSRLHSAQSQVDSGQTPLGTTPLLQQPDDDSEPPSKTNTPRIGASTPRPGSSHNNAMKRILNSKDPKKARAMELEKEKKRKERETARETAASDRETAKAAKRQPAKKAQQPKIKSAELVHSSDDESGEEGEVKEGEVKRVDSKTSPQNLKPKPNDARAKVRTSQDSGSDGPAKKKTRADPAKSIASLSAARSAAGKVTPRTNANTNGLSAPPSQHKSARSPQKQDSKPSVPSPLGAARPRVASDVSARVGVGVRHVKPGAATPQGLGITNGVRKRHDTVTSTESAMSSGSDKPKKETNGVHKAAPKPTTNGTPKVVANGTPKITASVKTNGVKRPADGPAEEPDSKHRKTTSISSQSQKSQDNSSTTAQSTARTSPDVTFDSGSSDSGPSVLDVITYAQGVTMAEKFRDQYYPAYAAMYDAQVAKEAKGEQVSKEERDRLLAMHRRLEQMKREIQTASEREHRED
ncbi:hypothetical protein LTR17_011169 [Elasticomyces elasticus]|nr:hypothetical protein LTR17_011169 [Elasticomyces elasticus]